MPAMQGDIELLEKISELENAEAMSLRRPWEPSTPYQKMISAGTGAILTSLLVTPFDVVKTRMQSGVMPAEDRMGPGRPAGVGSDDAALRGETRSIRPKPYGSVGKVPPSLISGTAAQGLRINGTWDGVVKIVRHEGILGLWRGLSPTLIMSVPSTVIYYIGYEHIRDGISGHLRSRKQEVYAPLLAGATARILAATVISPIELVRTRMQSTHSPLSLSTTLSNVTDMVRTSGWTSLWRGLAPTLWRDVPFSAIYWIGYESIKSQLERHFPKSRTVVPSVTEFQNAFVAGALSGTVAAIVTTPFDVAKTLEQISNGGGATRMGMVSIMKRLSPRVLKVAPACAVMISSYEVGKRFFENSNTARRNL
ncbi:hypothetical protein PhCBS80983_g04964 [Powellomyces hirtus]|uniref:Mitochondrial carrier protein n=1 Tax=Powellomyces hirtus TaxID=109895 RepID=A0A507DYE0_9FUNG|nr:hypothetical protein PhCBS80983_g04964 [Powellomyces hirtus]